METNLSKKTNPSWFYPTLKLTLTYVLFGGLWILLSDKILSWIIPDHATYVMMQTWKGWFFILLTALLVFNLVRRILLRVEAQKEEARLAKERLELALEAVRDGVWDWNLQNDTVYYSPGYTAMLGYDSVEVPAHVTSWLDLIHPDDREKTLGVNQECIDNKRTVFEVEFRMQHKNGDWRWIRGRGKVTERNASGQAVRMVGTHSDISERKEYEEKILKAKHEAEKANAAKSEFLANMSHEIRTPLNGILGMLQLMQTTAMDEEQQEFTGNAITSCRRLNTLLSDILDLSRVEAGVLKVQSESFVLTELFNTTRLLFLSYAEQKHLELTFEIDQRIPPLLRGDAPRLQQILNNLVGNAVKFTEQGGVAVQAYLLRLGARECTVLFSVHDTGTGIDDKDLDYLFEAFTQAESNYQRKHQGAGLGLAICKRLIRLMNGTMVVESEPDNGTTFYFSLRFDRVAPVEE